LIVYSHLENYACDIDMVLFIIISFYFRCDTFKEL